MDKKSNLPQNPPLQQTAVVRCFFDLELTGDMKFKEEIISFIKAELKGQTWEQTDGKSCLIGVIK